METGKNVTLFFQDKMFWDISSEVVSIEPGSDQQNNTVFSLTTTMFLLYKYFQYRSLTRSVSQEPEKEYIELFNAVKIKISL